MKMSLKPRSAIAVTLLASALLFGCSKEEEGAGAISGGTSAGAASSASAASAKRSSAPTAAEGPAEQMMQVVSLFRSNDLRGLVKASIPESDYKEMISEWEKTRAEPISEQDRKEFADAMAKIAGPNAVDKLMTEVEPKLAELKAQLPLFIGMGMMSAQQAISASEDMTDEQKEQATAMLNATQAWAMKTDFADPARLRKALTEISNGVKAMKLDSLDQIQKMSVDQLLDKGGVMLASTKRAFNAYDLNLDEAMSSFKAEQISMSGDKARIRTSMTFLGENIVSESDMVKKDGRWMSQESIDMLKKMSENSSADAEMETEAGN
jgi:major membrane immunogen (membrane-anchored lipoprotein)